LIDLQSVIRYRCIGRSLNTRNRIAEFKIDDTDFGIESSDSVFTTEVVDGIETITAEIRGSQATYESISADEGSEWGWTLYPPHLYLRGIPALGDSTSGLTVATITLKGLDTLEAGIYLMSHNDVDAVNVIVDPGNSIYVSGEVLIGGRTRSFSLTWNPASVELV